MGLLAIMLAACGGTVASSPATPSLAVVTPSVAATARPTPLSRSAYAAQHITESVTRLMNITDPEGIKAWIREESDWLDTGIDQGLPILRPYLIAMTGALSDVVFENDNTNYAVTALDIIAAAREVPGVELP